MRRAISVALACATGCSVALAGGNADSTIWSAARSGAIDSGWVVQVPTGSADCFDQTYRVSPGIGDVDGSVVAGGLPVTGIAVSVADFGSGRTFARVGVYLSNLGVDPTGETPDLAQAVTSVASPPLVPPPLFHFAAFDLEEGVVASGSSRVHAVAQLPPGDSGLLGVGADSGSASSGVYAGFTTDGYGTPSVSLSFLDFGLDPGQDDSVTTSCLPADRLPHGRLRASHLRQGVGEGDAMRATIRAGDVLDLVFLGTRTGDRFRFFYAPAPCTPLIAVGPVLGAIPDPDGDGSYLRVNATWPAGYGGHTYVFSAVWGNAACAAAGAGFTNCITIVTSPDPTFGICDDGTIESGWVVQQPSGSADYFNNDFGDGTAQNGVTGLSIAVLDFGTAVPAFPRSGVANANYSVDASGHTPDLGSPLALVAPFTFPAGAFDTTSQQYTSHVVAIPGSSLGAHVHAWVQFPPGDSGLLAVGADSTSINGCSFFTTDGYTTASVSFLVNWGIRLATN